MQDIGGLAELPCMCRFWVAQRVHSRQLIFWLLMKLLRAPLDIRAFARLESD